MRKLVLVFALLATMAALADEEVPLPIWKMPQVWQRHTQLRSQLFDVLRRGDAEKMEEICREALRVMPGDATWHYNLACALAHRATPGVALNELATAIDFGFHDADAIARDKDFESVRSLPRFAELVERARSLKGKPGRGHPEPKTAIARPGRKLVLEAENLGWNFDAGVFEARMKIEFPSGTISQQAGNFGRSKPTDPGRPYVVAWISEGTSLGNVGDLYVNRDNGHSMLAVGDFPGLVNVVPSHEAKAAHIDIDHPNTIYPNCAVFGNISRAKLGGPYWRSLGRASMTESSLAVRMNLLYRLNQFWVMPAHMDFGKKDIGDVFPGVAPFHFVTVGSSWTDQGPLRAALAASASFRRPVKEEIVRRHLVGPTMQWLIRRTRKGIDTEEDYLSPKAHPTAFSGSSLDAERLVETAHDLRLDQIPPVVSLNLINSRKHPIRYPTPVRDYPDAISEVLYSTSSAICLVLRAVEGERTFLFHARADGADTPSTFTWRVVHGDASAVKIVGTGEADDATPERGFAKILIDRRNVTNRIDVACFAKTETSSYGAPSFISFFPVPQETRTYRPDGQIASIDYTNERKVYSDPVVSLPRRWKDVYSYDAGGKPFGWARISDGKEVAAFTASGHRIVERRADGTPSKAVRVKYIPRATNDKMEPLTLSYMDDGEPFDVK